MFSNYEFKSIIFGIIYVTLDTHTLKVPYITNHIKPIHYVEENYRLSSFRG